MTMKTCSGELSLLTGMLAQQIAKKNCRF